jgi:ribonucleoside-diphosphate reductase alpha chain
LTAIMHAASYATSAEMAKEQGPFPRYHANRDAMLRVMRNHRRAAYQAKAEEYEGLTITPEGLDAAHCPQYLVEAARAECDRMLALGEKHGYRNAQVTVIAPTGTIGLVMDCDTTGVEPDFALVKFKKLAGGGYFKIINTSVPPALVRLGYSRQQIDEIVRYCQGTGTLNGCPHINSASLKAKGFTDEVLQRVEAQLPGAFELGFVLNRWTVGDEFCKTALKIPQEKLETPGFDLLNYLGFTREQIAEANAVVCGTMTIEGAPHLKPEHLSVFDCANKCGKNGQRFLSAEAHIRILHRHAQGRRRLPQHDQLLRHCRVAGPPARRAAGRVRRRFHLHPLRAERGGAGQPAHQDVDFDHRLHLPRAGGDLPRPRGPGARQAGRSARRRHARRRG